MPRQKGEKKVTRAFSIKEKNSDKIDRLAEKKGRNKYSETVDEIVEEFKE